MACHGTCSSRPDNCLEPVPDSDIYLDHVIYRSGCTLVAVVAHIVVRRLSVDRSETLCDTDLTACSAAAHMDMDTRFNDGPVQTSNSRPEETGLSDPASFIQDLANKV